LTDGRLYEALRDGAFVLVLPAGGLQEIDAGEQVRLVRAAAPGPAMLVRPDGYVAWAAEHADPATIRAAVAGWIRPVRTVEGAAG
jgi:hypothetical protein